MAIEINGIAHVIVTVQELDKVREFYRGLTKAFSMECLVDTVSYTHLTLPTKA